MKQVIQMQHNMVKNPKWLGANQLGGTTPDYQEQIQLAVRAGFELGASEWQVKRYNRLATLPHLLNNHCSDIFSCKESSGELPRYEMYFMSPWTKSLAPKIKRNVKLSYGIICHLISQKGSVGVFFRIKTSHFHELLNSSSLNPAL